MNPNPTARLAKAALKCLSLGFFGGWLSATLIFTVQGLIGRNGSTGCEYVGYFSLLGALFFGLIYGAPLGILFYPAAYAIIRKRRLHEGRSNGWVLACIVFLGSVGSVLNIFIALYGALMGFAVACLFLSKTRTAP